MNIRTELERLRRVVGAHSRRPRLLPMWFTDGALYWSAHDESTTIDAATFKERATHRDALTPFVITMSRNTTARNEGTIG